MLPAFWSWRKHLRIREDLSGIAAGELEELPQEGGFVHPRKQSQISRESCFDKRIEHVPAPSLDVSNEGCGSGISAEQDELIERPAERLADFGERPMREVNDLEPSGETLSEAAPYEKRRRTEQDDLERKARRSILVPEPLYRFGPVRELVRFVDDEDSSACILGRVARLVSPTPFVAQKSRRYSGGSACSGYPSGTLTISQILKPGSVQPFATKPTSRSPAAIVR